MGGVALIGLAWCAVAIAGFALYGAFLGLSQLAGHLHRLWLGASSAV